jgi:hypothetical protein
MLPRQFGMPLEVGAQTGLMARIDQRNGTPEQVVFNALVMRQVQSIGGDWLFDASLETGPAEEPALAGDGELRAA